MSAQTATIKESLISFRSLAAATCPCGGRKRPRQTFCGSCWHSLPQELQRGLMRADGYADVWIRALAHHRLPLPGLDGLPVPAIDPATITQPTLL